MNSLSSIDSPAARAWLDWSGPSISRIGSLNYAKKPFSTYNVAEVATLDGEEDDSLLYRKADTFWLGEKPRFGNLGIFESWFPEVIPNSHNVRNWRTGWSNRRTALAAQQLMASLVFLVNVSWIGWALMKYGTQDTIGTIYQGHCDKVKKLNLWLHLLINVLSTVLLGTSNYCMQLLMAPTPREVIDAHKEKMWLDIGIPSIRNLRRIERKRITTWCLLGLSSGFLHLIWNSAIYTSIPINLYSTAIVTNDFLSNSKTWNTTDPSIKKLESEAPGFQRLDSAECIERYINPLGTGLNVVVVTNTPTNEKTKHDNTSLIASFNSPGSGIHWSTAQSWICDAYPEVRTSFCSMQFMNQFSNNWTVGDKKGTYNASVDYCLSAGAQLPDERCGLLFSPIVMGLVCILNLVKCVCIWYTAYRDLGSALVTIGDAISYFLRNPDSSTKGLCLSSKADFGHQQWGRKHGIWNPPKRIFWYQAASLRRWMTTLVPWGIILLIAGFALRSGLHSYRNQNIPVDFRSLFTQELGGVYPYALTSNHLEIKESEVKSFIFSTFFANLFQLLGSFLYLLYNNLLTCLLVAREWSRYAHNRKTLRVSSPRGIQRSSYFLSLPYCYAVPLTMASGLLHWLISQAIFPVQTRGFDQNGNRLSQYDGSRIGYSPMGIILCMLLLGVMFVSLVITGLRQFTAGSESMPLVSTCSAAISAACHAPPGDDHAYLLPVQWGEIPNADNVITDAGHCCFTTAADVRLPVPGRSYE